MLIRVRTNAGLWRVPDLTATSTVSDLRSAISATRPMVQYTTPFCSDPGCRSPLGEDSSKTLGELGLGNGSMVYCGVVAETCAEAGPPAAASAAGTAGGGDEAAAASVTGGTGGSGGANMKRIIGKDGSIKLVPADNAEEVGADDGRGFRRGQMALRDMKMQWTLAEFTAMDAQYNFKVREYCAAWWCGVVIF